MALYANLSKCLPMRDHCLVLIGARVHVHAYVEKQLGTLQGTLYATLQR